MPVTTRNGHLRQQNTPTKMTVASSTTTRTLSRQAARPTPYLLLFYPLILAIGSLYSVISPVAQAEINLNVDPAIATPPPQPNYFAGKRNLVNIIFVKRGWLWTSLAFILLQITTKPNPKATPNPTSNRKVNHWLQATLRYVMVTSSWIFMTQWFFGPSLIDRSFTLSGGRCEGRPQKTSSTGRELLEKFATTYSASACKASGGRWKGGHDISGHVFILILSSAFLLYELYLADTHSQHPSVSPAAAANVAHDMTEEEKRAVGGWESEGEAKLRIYARYFLYSVVVLDLLMLLTTAIWFHTWLEKLNGMLVAGLTLYLTYFLGDFVPAWREIIGGV